MERIFECISDDVIVRDSYTKGKMYKLHEVSETLGHKFINDRGIVSWCSKWMVYFREVHFNLEIL